jgi:hypothetical protein
MSAHGQTSTITRLTQTLDKVTWLEACNQNYYRFNLAQTRCGKRRRTFINKGSPDVTDKKPPILTPQPTDSKENPESPNPSQAGSILAHPQCLLSAPVCPVGKRWLSSRRPGGSVTPSMAGRQTPPFPCNHREQSVSKIIKRTHSLQGRAQPAACDRMYVHPALHKDAIMVCIWAALLMSDDVSQMGTRWPNGK